MRYDTISVGVQDRLTTESIPETRLRRFMADAIRFYSRYNPYVRQTEFQTVADQRAYAFATYLTGDVTAIFHCLWPSEVWSAARNVGSELATLQAEPFSYDQVSLEVIRRIKRDAFYARTLGTWEVENQSIVLIPTPGTAGTDVLATYGVVHEENATATGVDTIPTQDLEIMTDLTLAEFYQSRMGEVAIEPDYMEGLQRVTKHYMPGNIAELIRRLRAPCLAKYDRPAGMQA